MIHADAADMQALNALVAWRDKDAAMRTFSVSPRETEDGEYEWAVHLHSKRWRPPWEDQVQERSMWHCGPTLRDAVRLALRTAK